MERIQAQMGEGRVEIEGLELDAEVSNIDLYHTMVTFLLWLTGTGDQFADTSLDTTMYHLWLPRQGDGPAALPKLMVCSSGHLPEYTRARPSLDPASIH